MIFLIFTLPNRSPNFRCFGKNLNSFAKSSSLKCIFIKIFAKWVLKYYAWVSQKGRKRSYQLLASSFRLIRNFFQKQPRSIIYNFFRNFSIITRDAIIQKRKKISSLTINYWQIMYLTLSEK